MRIQCIIGLGNPGAQYAKTRHNVGAWFADELASRENAAFKKEKQLHGYAAKFSAADNSPIWIFKPSTFMNESGIAVSQFIQFYKISTASILIVHDELDFEAGIARLKKGGGHGGHNGLRDIISHIGADFYRLRLGIGHPGHRDQVTDYVLQNPSRADHTKIIQSIDDALAVMPQLFNGEIQQAFHALHSESEPRT